MVISPYVIISPRRVSGEVGTNPFPWLPMSLGSHASASSRRSGGSHQKKDAHPLSAEIQIVALRLHANLVSRSDDYPPVATGGSNPYPRALARQTPHPPFKRSGLSSVCKATQCSSYRLPFEQYTPAKGLRALFHQGALALRALTPPGSVTSLGLGCFHFTAAMTLRFLSINHLISSMKRIRISLGCALPVDL